MSKEITINIPEVITVGQYQKFGTLDHLTNTERIIRIVSAITDYSEEEVGKWNVSNLFTIYKDLQGRIDELEAVFLPIFEWDGVTWGFQPIHKMTGGEYIDLESRLQEGVLKINEVLAILYRPITEHRFDGLEWKIKSNVKYALGKAESLFKYYTLEDYDTEKRDWRAERFKDLPVGLGLGAYNFFLFVGMKFLENLKTYSPQAWKQMTKTQKENLHLLQATMAGSTPYTTSLKKEES